MSSAQLELGILLEEEIFFFSLSRREYGLMGHDWSDNILIAKLPAEPQTSDELTAVTALALERPGSDLIVDLVAVDEPTCQSLCELMKLSSLLSSRGRRCVFCNVSEAARQTFAAYGFDRLVEIAALSEVVFTPSVEQLSTGTLELRSSDKAKPLQRRKYVRLNVPPPLEMDVLLWHGGRKDDYHKLLPGHSWRGRLVDISEGGAQVAIDAAEDTTLGRGRLVGLEFSPKPGEPLLAFDAQVREILPTADGKNICLGLKFVGSEANPEAHQGLHKLCNAEGVYYEAKENATV
jgi:anti-anti-sigma regulatory factor